MELLAAEAETVRDPLPQAEGGEMNEHELVVMVPSEHFAHKSRPHGRFRSGTNVWFRVFTCPDCNRKSQVLSNPTRGKVIACDGKGTRYLKVQP